MARAALVTAAVVAALAVSANAPAGGGQSVRDSEQTVVEASFRGQFGKVWALLHPRYQQVVPRAFWESCKRKQAQDVSGADFLSFKVLSTYPDRITLPLLGTLNVTAVTASVTFRYLGQKQTVSDTVYWTRVRGQWRGLWKPADYKAYSHRRCPA